MAYVRKAEVQSLQMQNRKGQEGAALCVLLNCRLPKRIPHTPGTDIPNGYRYLATFRGPHWAVDA